MPAHPGARRRTPSVPAPSAPAAGKRRAPHDSAALARSVRLAMSELRAAVDSLDPAERSLDEALGDLRGRLEPLAHRAQVAPPAAHRRDEMEMHRPRAPGAGDGAQHVAMAEADIEQGETNAAGQLPAAMVETTTPSLSSAHHYPVASSTFASSKPIRTTLSAASVFW